MPLMWERSSRLTSWERRSERPDHPRSGLFLLGIRVSPRSETHERSWQYARACTRLATLRDNTQEQKSPVQMGRGFAHSIALTKSRLSASDSLATASAAFLPPTGRYGVGPLKLNVTHFSLSVQKTPHSPRGMMCPPGTANFSSLNLFAFSIFIFLWLILICPARLPSLHPVYQSRHRPTRFETRCPARKTSETLG